MRILTSLLTVVLCSASTAVVVRLLAEEPFAEELLVAELLTDEPPAQWLVDDSEGESSPSRAGRFLVAQESVRDTAFAGTTVYLLIDDDEGSVGVIVNRPLPQHPHGLALHHGGPVGPHGAIVLHDETWPGSIELDDGVRVATDASILDALARGAGPAHARVFVGYAGWAPGQLDAEMNQGAWALAAGDVLGRQASSERNTLP